MEIFANSKFYGYKLVSINRGRIYLQVIHLSDITTEDGVHISKDAYNGEIERWSTPHYE